MHAAHRTASFTESVIREMTRIANLHEAVNLSQGFPDFPMPEPMKQAACTAINADINQYAVTWGTATLRNAIAEKYRRWYKMEVDPDTEAPYEHMVYSGHHHEIATWPGMRERTVTISSLSKTFSCTGWRIGYAIAPTAQTNAIRKVHDFLTVGAPAPLQAAAAVGFAFD